jgi:WD40 repeat protein
MYGQRLVFRIDDQTLNIVDLTDADPFDSRLVLSNSSWGHLQVVSPNGRWLATGGASLEEIHSSGAGAIELRDLSLASGPALEPTFTLDVAKHTPFLLFSKDSRWLTDGTHLWDLNSTAGESRNYVLAIPQEDLFVTSASFSQSGKWLATSAVHGATGGVWLYDLTSERPGSTPIGFYPGPEMSGSTVMFSADERWLVGMGYRNLLWPLDANELVELACRTAGRNLTAHEWQQYVGSGDYRTTCPDLPSGEQLRTPGSDISDMSRPVRPQPR